MRLKSPKRWRIVGNGTWSLSMSQLILLLICCQLNSCTQSVNSNDATIEHQNDGAVTVRANKPSGNESPTTSTSSITTVTASASSSATTTATPSPSTTAITTIESTTSHAQPSPRAELARPNSSRHGKQKHNSDSQTRCEYEKGPWTECENNGVQQRTLKLTFGGAKCQPIKTIRRACKIASGCKYTRGEWSANCLNGLRVRVDKLVSRVGVTDKINSNNGTATACQPQRTVTKDCKRACHYVKSAWSECVDGFKTRNVTLSELPLYNHAPKDDARTLLAADSLPAGCAKQRLVRRECRARELSPNTYKDQASMRNSNSGNQAPKLTAAQKRRLKQLQRQQQSSTISPVNPSSKSR